MSNNEDHTPIAWTVGLIDLPLELQMEIFLSLFNQQSVIALRLACHELEDVYQRIPNAVRADQRERIIAPVRNYIEFLDRFKLPERRLRYPPPGGWPHVKPEPGNRFELKTAFAIDILRHLPYIRGDFEDHDTCFAHRSTMIDYSVKKKYDDGHDIWLKGYERLGNKRPRPSGERHVITIAIGWEGAGHHFYIDTWTGLIYEEEEEWGPCAPIIMAYDFFEDRIKSLKRFDEVFVPGEHTILRRQEHFEREEEPWQDGKEWDREERYIEYGPDDDPYDAEAMERQGEYDGTDEEFGCMEDADWIRHLYFKHGWGGNWDKEACLQAIRDFVERRHERSGEF